MIINMQRMESTFSPFSFLQSPASVPGSRIHDCVSREARGSPSKSPSPGKAVRMILQYTCDTHAHNGSGGQGGTEAGNNGKATKAKMEARGRGNTEPCPR
jgi:hypothetical protein